MRQTIIQAAAGIALLGAAITGIAFVDAQDGGPVKVTGYADPVPCVITVEQVMLCGSPAASPVATETQVPTPFAMLSWQLIGCPLRVPTKYPSSVQCPDKRRGTRHRPPPVNPSLARLAVVAGLVLGMVRVYAAADTASTEVKILALLRSDPSGMMAAILAHLFYKRKPGTDRDRSYSLIAGNQAIACADQQPASLRAVPFDAGLLLHRLGDKWRFTAIIECLQ